MACANPPPIGDEEEDIVQSGDSPDMVKRIRTTKLAGLSKLANRILDHIRDSGSRKVLKVYRSQFCEIFDECVKLHSRYNLLAKPEGNDLVQENNWLLKLDDKVNQLLREIDGHLKSRDGQTETCSTVSSRSVRSHVGARSETAERDGAASERPILLRQNHPPDDNSRDRNKRPRSTADVTEERARPAAPGSLDNGRTLDLDRWTAWLKEYKNQNREDPASPNNATLANAPTTEREPSAVSPTVQRQRSEPIVDLAQATTTPSEFLDSARRNVMDALTMQPPPARQHAVSPANVNESTNDPSSQNSAADTIMAPSFTNFESQIRQTMPYRSSRSDTVATPTNAGVASQAHVTTSIRVSHSDTIASPTNAGETSRTRVIDQASHADPIASPTIVGETSQFRGALPRSSQESGVFATPLQYSTTAGQQQRDGDEQLRIVSENPSSRRILRFNLPDKPTGDCTFVSPAPPAPFAPPAPSVPPASSAPPAPWQYQQHQSTFQHTGPSPPNTWPPNPHSGVSPSQGHVPFSADGWIHGLGNSSQQTTPAPVVYARPPALTLSVFNGDPQEWPSFIAGFKVLIHDTVGSDAERLFHLRNYLGREIRDHIGESLLNPGLYAYAMKELQAKYGNPQMVAQACSARLTALGSFKDDDFKALRHFSSRVRGVVATLKNGGFHSQLACFTTLQHLLSKLPSTLRRSWGKRSWQLEPKLPTLEDFDNWLNEVFMEESRAQPISQRREQRDKPQIHHAASDNTPGSSQSENGCPTCGNKHDLDQCARFKDLSVEKRAEIVKNNRRCFRCLKGGHRSIDCQQTVPCEKDGCKYKHHALLHGAPVMWKRRSSSAKKNPPLCGTTRASKIITMLPIVPVYVAMDGLSIKTYALLDSGSEITLIRGDIADALLLTGPYEEQRIGTFHAQDPVIKTRRVNFHLSSLEGDSTFMVSGAYAVQNLNVRRREIPPSSLVSWPHLQDIVVHPESDLEVTILLGMDVSDAHDVFDERKAFGIRNAPKAILTPFGWCVVGRLKGGVQPAPPDCNMLSTEEPNESFENLVRGFIDGESFGTHPHVKRPIPADDERAIRQIEATIRYTGERYEVGLPWKFDEPGLVDNFTMALKLFEAQERRFRRNPQLAVQYTQIMDGYLRDGYAHLVSPEELAATPPGRSYYPPHHAVVHPNKPGKVRPVFNASSRFQGVSLNDQLLKGPDLLTSLVGSLIRFRKFKHAVTADIEKMFYQVRVSPVDGPAFRYIWKAPDPKESPRIYQMNVHIFGAISSPTVCNFALRRTAADNEREFPGLTAKIRDHFYADNYMESFDDRSLAMDTCQQIRQCLLRGGFKLTQWASSDRDILSSLPGELLTDPSLNLDLDNLPTERVLGLTWNCERDTFQLLVKQKEIRASKRELMQAISSVFDPLGFLAPVVFVAKLLMRDAWKTPADWDDHIDPALLERWTEWSNSLATLRDIHIPRCYKSTPWQPDSMQIHAFSDASEVGFGAVIYLRMEFGGGVQTAFVISKTRIAPKKTQTIPRLELNGALLAARLVDVVKREMRTQADKIFFWTDSTTVLRWLSSRSCRYHTYVANRTGEILELTDAKSWRYVRSKDNPADDCCRGLSANELNANHRWFQAPEFLKQPEDTWPVFPDAHAPHQNELSDPEVKETFWTGAQSVSEPDPFDLLLERRSSIEKIARVTAYVIRFCHNTRKPPAERQRHPLTAVEIASARQVLIRKAQAKCFSDDIREMKDKNQLPKNSKLQNLSPFIDRHGLLRVGGRLKNAKVSYGMKHPLILPSRHRITELIIKYFHNKLAHASVERMLSEIRSTYWIMRSRATIKSAVRDCISCRRRNAKPNIPLMAALPSCRLSALNPPFSHTGVDMFGPFTISMLRRSLKRYGIIFTCMTTRAVHLEVVHSMDMDSFLLCFKRFVARRGKPAHCYSDNGTNFIAAEKEIADGILRWNKEKMIEQLAAEGVDWHFNPPAAPHFGGAWESLIKSAKSALKHILHGRTLTDEVLHTALVLVESLLNGRPLTHVSVDATDPEPLTPNHLLLGRPLPYTPFDIVEDGDLNAKRRWRVAHAIAHHFWRRWMKEYLPRLTERRKWLVHHRNLTVGDIVIVIDRENSVGNWPTGRVMETFAGQDGVVRSALVRTQGSEYHRPVAKLCLLEEADQQTNVFRPENRAGDVADRAGNPGTLA